MKKNTFLFVLSLLVLLIACAEKHVQNNGISAELPLVIVSKTDEGAEFYRMYRKWLEVVFSDSVEILDINGKELAYVDSVVSLADALVLCGGPNVDPSRYDSIHLSHFCHTDLKRDTNEFFALEKAQQMKIPVLGICRGFQLINVALSGTLYANLPSQKGVSYHHEDANDAHHLVYWQSPFHGFSVGDSLEVNSSHFQGVRVLGHDLEVLAISPDSLVEAFRTKPGLGWPVLAVQWHPERLPWHNPMSLQMARTFFKENGVINP